jgi:hypothetical protein
MKIRLCSKSEEMDPFQFTVHHGKSIGKEDQGFFELSIRYTNWFLDLASGTQIPLS